MWWRSVANFVQPGRPQRTFSGGAFPSTPRTRCESSGTSVVVDHLHRDLALARLQDRVIRAGRVLSVEGDDEVGLLVEREAVPLQPRPRVVVAAPVPFGRGGLDTQAAGRRSRGSERVRPVGSAGD